MAEDYRVLLDALDPILVGFAPDAGHIARGGMDPLAIFHQYAAYKAMTAEGAWCAMGDGMIDFPRLTADLRQNGQYLRTVRMIAAARPCW